MHSHRRPRGRIFFEVLCALIVGASFVGAWIQTGAWAFIGPAFVFTLFGLYWSFDMFGSREAAVVAEAVAAPAPVAEPDPVAAPEPEPKPEIRFERFEAPVVEELPAEPAGEIEAVQFVPEPEPEPVIEPAPVARAEPKPKVRKARARKAAEPVAEQAPAVAAEDPALDHHIEQLFDPQPFARQARPAFGKRPRGPGSRPLPV